MQPYLKALSVQRLSTGSTVIVWYHFLNFLPAFFFFYSLSLPLYFAFGQYFLSHSPCICICECLRVGPLILVLVETEILMRKTSFSLSFMSCFRILMGVGEQIDTGVGLR